MINFGSKALWFISHFAILLTSYPTSGLHKNVRKISSFNCEATYEYSVLHPVACPCMHAPSPQPVVVCAEFSHVQKQVSLHDFFLECFMTPLILKSRRVKLHVYYPHPRDPRGCACALQALLHVMTTRIFSFFFFLELAVLIEYESIILYFPRKLEIRITQ